MEDLNLEDLNLEDLNLEDLNLEEKLNDLLADKGINPADVASQDFHTMLHFLVNEDDVGLDMVMEDYEDLEYDPYEGPEFDPEDYDILDDPDDFDDTDSAYAYAYRGDVE